MPIITNALLFYLYRLIVLLEYFDLFLCDGSLTGEDSLSHAQ